MRKIQGKSRNFESGGKRIKIAIAMWLAALPLFGASAASNSADEDARSFVQSLYRHSTGNFELSTFDGRLDLRRNCELLKQYFAEPLAKQATLNSGCSLGVWLSVRYPSLRLEDLLDSTALSRIPRPEFSVASANEDRAMVRVQTGNGRTVYFLKKMTGEWRVVNAAIYEQWPSADGLCVGNYLTTPTPEQKDAIAKGC